MQVVGGSFHDRRKTTPDNWVCSTVHIAQREAVQAQQFLRQKTVASTTGAAVSGFGLVPQLRTIRRYFASNTSGIPCYSFIPAQLFAFAGTWMTSNLFDIAYGTGFVLVRRPTLGQLPGTR